MATFETVKGAACWASYLINGDASGIDEAERALCDAWCKHSTVADVVDCADEAHFSWYFGFHTGHTCSGGDLLEYTCRMLDVA